ncbi:MAG: hypothetical protein ACFCD0_09450 [Gemmataceae bacterium]
MRLHTTTFAIVSIVLFGLAIEQVNAQQPLSSGLKVGRRPGPYTSVVSVGKERGTSHCYICESLDRPVLIVFARELTPELGKLVTKIDAEEPNQEKGLRAWVTFLHEDQASIDKKIITWAKKHAVRNMPIGVFEDLAGPPTYLLSKQAEVTVLLSVDYKVVGNFAFRKGELNDKAITKIVKTLPKIMGK